MTTDSETALRTPHSAHPHPPDNDLGEHDEQTAPHDQTAHTQSDRKDLLGVFWRSLELHDLPEVFTQPQPSLTQIWRYSTRGRWTKGKSPIARSLHRAYALAAFVVIAALYLAAWCWDRPTRLLFSAIVLVAVCTLLSFLPIGRLVPDFLNARAWFGGGES